MTSVPGPNDPDTAYPHDDNPVTAGTPNWFTLAAAPYTGTSITPTWTDFTDGVPDPVDAEVNGFDTTRVKILTAGLYQFVCDLTIISSAGQAAEVQLNCHLNDDSVGPLYDLYDYCSVTGGGKTYRLRVSTPMVFAEDDEVYAEVAASGHACQVVVGYMTLVRVG